MDTNYQKAQFPIPHRHTNLSLLGFSTCPNIGQLMTSMELIFLECICCAMLNHHLYMSSHRALDGDIDD